MKKVLFSACALTFFACTSAMAQTAEAQANPAQQVQAQQPEKTQVPVTDLPAAIQQTLATDAYKEWKVESAWLIKGATEAYYELQLKKGEESSSLKLDANGKLIG